MRYMASELERKIRFVGLSVSIANYRDIADWIGVAPAHTYNFLPTVRPIPLEVAIQTFDHNHRKTRLLAMAKPLFQAIKRHSEQKSVIVFVSDRKQARLTALDLCTYAMADGSDEYMCGLSP